MGADARGAPPVALVIGANHGIGFGMRLVNTVCPGLAVGEGSCPHHARRPCGKRMAAGRLGLRRVSGLVSMEADRVLTLRELNRATLARQMLLDREPLPVSEAVERLVGLQAQVPNPPYIGLWTRLRDFRRDDLTRLLE